MNAQPRLDQLLGRLFGLFRIDPILDQHGKPPHPAARVERLGKRGKGNVDALRLVLRILVVALGRIHADHAENHPLNLNRLAQRLFAHLKEDVFYPAPDHAHLALAGQVALIEKAALGDVHGLDLRILRDGTVYIKRSALLATGDIVGAAVATELHLWTHQVQVLGVGLDPPHIVDVHFHIPAALVALVGQAGAHGPSKHAVGHVVAHVGLDPILEAPRSTYRDDDHEQAPAYTQRRQEGAQRIAHHHLHEFHQPIAIQPHHSYRRASMGRMRTARKAGTKPEIAPATTNTANAVKVTRRFTSGSAK